MAEQQKKLYIGPEALEILLLVLRVDEATGAAPKRRRSELQSVKQIAGELIGPLRKERDATSV